MDEPKATPWPNQLPVVPGVEEVPQDPDLFDFADDEEGEEN